MIGTTVRDRIFDSAFRVASSYHSRGSRPLRDVLSWPQVGGLTRRHVRAQRFVEQVLRDEPEYAGKVAVHFEYDGLGPNHVSFASWLIVDDDGRISITLNMPQIDEWARGDASLEKDLQCVRAMIHELGHLIVTPEIVDTRLAGPVKSSVPEQEEMAWVWTFAVLGLALGDYSLNSRKSKRGDESARIPL